MKVQKILQRYCNNKLAVRMYYVYCGCWKKQMKQTQVYIFCLPVFKIRTLRLTPNPWCALSGSEDKVSLRA